MQKEQCSGVDISEVPISILIKYKLFQRSDVMIKNSIAFASKLIIFIDSDVSQLNSSTLQDLFTSEHEKHQRGFSEVVFCGTNKSSRLFPLQ